MTGLQLMDRDHELAAGRAAVKTNCLRLACRPAPRDVDGDRQCNGFGN